MSKLPLAAVALLVSAVGGCSSREAPSACAPGQVDTVVVGGQILGLPSSLGAKSEASDPENTSPCSTRPRSVKWVSIEGKSAARAAKQPTLASLLAIQVEPAKPLPALDTFKQVEGHDYYIQHTAKGFNLQSPGTPIWGKPIYAACTGEAEAALCAVRSPWKGEAEIRIVITTEDRPGISGHAIETWPDVLADVERFLTTLQ